MNKEIVDISVIIPVFNVENYIEECVLSVMQQENIGNLKVECIVVDDCGTDRSMQIAEELIFSYSGPIQFRIERCGHNRGLSGARNLGIRSARGKYLYFLDSDDFISSVCLNSLYEVALKYPEAQIINGDYVMFPSNLAFNEKGLRNNKNLPEYLGGHKEVAQYWFETVPVSACNKLIKREFLKKFDLYFKEGILFEDNHWKIMAFEHVDAVAFVNRITYHYRMREGSIMHDVEFQKKYEKYLSIIYSEFFSKSIHQDKNYYKWIFSSLNNFKFSKSPNSNIIYKELVEVLLKNSTLPNKLRPIIYYHQLPRPWMRVAVCNALLRLI